jgi:hypothetical protein
MVTLVTLRAGHGAIVGLRQLLLAAIIGQD